MVINIQKITSLLFFLSVLSTGIFALPETVSADGYASSTAIYAYGENIGWLNASSTHERLVVSAKGITGYMWGENIGWIKFDHDGVAGATNTSATDWGVVNDGAGNLSGYAWGENIGWINFNPTHSQVVIDPDTGQFSGYAWAENIGWIDFGHGAYDYVMEWHGSPWVTTNEPDIDTDVTANAYAAKVGSTITERGFKYSTLPADDASVSSSGSFSSGDFFEIVDILCGESDYYIRAYATNEYGTSYGDYVFFSAISSGSAASFRLSGQLKFQGSVRYSGVSSGSGGGGGSVTCSETVPGL